MACAQGAMMDAPIINAAQASAMPTILFFCFMRSLFFGDYVGVGTRTDFNRSANGQGSKAAGVAGVASALTGELKGTVVSWGATGKIGNS
jgi:hypothetical protein